MISLKANFSKSSEKLDESTILVGILSLFESRSISVRNNPAHSTHLDSSKLRVESASLLEETNMSRRLSLSPAESATPNLVNSKVAS